MGRAEISVHSYLLWMLPKGRELGKGVVPGGPCLLEGGTGGEERRQER